MPDPLLVDVYGMLERQLTQFREAIAGIPEDDLNSWKPSAEAGGGGEMNTLAALAVHITAAGTWRVFQQVYGDEVHRDREAEFHATATIDEIGQMFDAWLAGYRERLERPDQPDLTTLPNTPREDHPDWTRMRWLLTTIDHNALHLGHVQIHRQLWMAERASSPQ
jgi:hypothetical protein